MPDNRKSKRLFLEKKNQFTFSLVGHRLVCMVLYTLYIISIWWFIPYILLGISHRASLADDGNLNLSWVGHLGLNLVGNLA